ncbi:acetyltransferase [Lojkania enalia]|uniref:Acetyltransferase n=1 Tax=Lojkania enalia TaxID=147567 RepID=A0A9P4K241_9PLEO|nr:acetyltransferase [Didymosphaeria enalia]
METKEWRRTIGDQDFLISTSRDLLPHEFVQKVFDHPDVFWAKPTSQKNMKAMLDNSCTLGVFSIGNAPNTPSTPIGMARMITDYTTFAYLTDVFIYEDYRKLGLAKWLISCCKDIVLDMPDLRWWMLLTNSEHAQRMYERELGMKVLNKSEGGLTPLGVRRATLNARQAEARNMPDA